MDTNPVLEADSSSSPPPKRYPLCVAYIYRLPTNFQDSMLLEIRTLCLEKNIEFRIREFDSNKYQEDCDEIERLPALHLYERGAYMRTFYPVGRPIQIIQDAHANLVAEDWNSKKKRKQWKEWFHDILERIRAIGRKQSKLDKRERLEKQIREQIQAEEKERRKSINVTDT